MPILTIIVPVFNTIKYLRKCVDSILSQDFDDFEIILIDDGSTDGSASLCDILCDSDSRIRVVHQRHLGVAEARNTGVAMAKGEFVGFVDSDDWIEPGMFRQMIAAANHHHADIAICRMQTVSPESGVLKVNGIDDEVVMDNVEATKQILCNKKIYSFLWDKVFSRKLFRNIKFPTGRLFEDSATTYKLFYRANRVVTTPSIGYNYLNNAQGVSKVSKDDSRWTRRMTDEITAAVERYFFAKRHKELSGITPFCAGTTYLMGLRFFDVCIRHGIKPTERQKDMVDKCMSDIEADDLRHLPLRQKADMLIVKGRQKVFSIYSHAKKGFSEISA